LKRHINLHALSNYLEEFHKTYWVLEPLLVVKAFAFEASASKFEAAYIARATLSHILDMMDRNDAWMDLVAALHTSTNKLANCFLKL
jgi:hypothetical protein